jgi:hypothetical protein
MEYRYILLRSVGLSACVLAAIIGLPLHGNAASVAVTGSAEMTFSSTNFSYDGVTPANLNLAQGQDNLGGHFTSQGVSEYTAGHSCVTPDGTTGTQFDLLQLDTVTTYSKGQLFLNAIGPSSAHLCATASGAIVGKATLLVTGGTGKLSNAAGTLVESFNGKVIASGAATGGYGDFGSLIIKYQGTVTY